MLLLFLHIINTRKVEASNQKICQFSMLETNFRTFIGNHCFQLVIPQIAFLYQIIGIASFTHVYPNLSNRQYKGGVAN